MLLDSDKLMKRNNKLQSDALFSKQTSTGLVAYLAATQLLSVQQILLLEYHFYISCRT